MSAIIRTNEPVIRDRIKTMRLVSSFWDKASKTWRDIWGPHIHHGFYDESSLSPIEAQEKLIVKICDLLNIQPKSKILDIGCGMGGSSFYLAEKYNAMVNGITLSRNQVAIASQYAREKNLDNVQFKIEDALALNSFADNLFDIGWSLESCEQFFDKERFIKQIYRKIKPGGKLMIATWCSDREEFSEKMAMKYRRLCVGFDVPYMPTIQHYQQLLDRHGFKVEYSLDWSEQVKPSWKIGISLLNTISFLKILRVAGWRGVRFAKQIQSMREAFEEGWIKYGVFIASKT